MADRTFLREVQGPSWAALLSKEPYGLHFSVSARRRQPTDDEVAQAQEAIPEATGFVEVWPRVRLNPYVRHYIPLEVARSSLVRRAYHDVSMN